MPRKISILLLSLSLIFSSGCRNSRQIENAAIIENVSVTVEGGQIRYTFYRLSEGEKPWGVTVRAESFEKACKKAREMYIPNMSLAKLELLMINERLQSRIMKQDVEYISQNSFFSPIAYVTLCDGKTMRKLDAEERVQDVIEEQLILLKKNKPQVCIDYLSVFNHLERECEGFYVPLIRCDGEIRVTAKRIYADKTQKNEK